MPPFGRRLQQHLKAECKREIRRKIGHPPHFSNTKTRLPCRVSTVKLTTTLTNCIRITDLSNKTGNNKLKLPSRFLAHVVQISSGCNLREERDQEPEPSQFPPGSLEVIDAKPNANNPALMFVQLAPHVTSICQTNVWHS